MSAITRGQPCWIDLQTSDLDASKAFYSNVFGWEFEDTGEDFGGYHMVRSEGAAVAGAMRKHAPEHPDAWVVYLKTIDAEAAAQQAAQAGAQIVVEPMTVGPRGIMMFLVDTAGAAIGGWQGDDFDGFEAVGRAGAPTWFECLSTDYEASKAFYPKAFDWDLSIMSDTPEFRYATLGEGENACAGIMDAKNFLPEGMPSVWQAYIGIADLDTTIAAITAGGGTILRENRDTPYGSLIQFADPTGAVLCAMQPPAGR